MKRDRFRFFLLDMLGDTESLAFQFVLLSTRGVECILQD
jgi:hypothetical protein